MNIKTALENNFKESKERAMYWYEQEKFDTYKQAGQFLKE